MTNLSLVLLGLTLLNIVISITVICKYKNDLKKEKLITSFSWARMDLIKMAHNGEISANSDFFNFILSASSYSIRGLCLYKTKSETLSKVDVLESVAKYCESQKLKEEYNNLNKEQKEMVVNVMSDVLQMYLDTHYIEKLIFKLFCKRSKIIVLNAYKNIKNTIAPKLKSGIDSAIKLDNYITCYAC